MIRPANAVLLTGAGFSKPFGGYLASEMWAVIFRQPDIRSSPSLRAALLKQLNFEQVYEDVTASEAYSEGDKQAFGEAIWRAYRQMHREMRDDGRRTNAWAVVQRFLARFATNMPEERGFVFTLNQDRLIETFQTTDVPVEIPGLPALTDDPEGQPVHLPSADELRHSEARLWSERGPRPLAYIKLHGSFEWRSALGGRAIVIGTNKSPSLEKEPLLRWYKNIFHDVLHAGDRSLLVVGYSFRDPHINATILSAVKSAGLKLFVLSRSTPDEFQARLSGVHSQQTQIIEHGDEIWASLYAYYSGSVDDYYVSNQVRLPPRGQALFEDLGIAMRPPTSR